VICRELSSQPRLRRSRLWFVALPVLAATLMVERPTPSAAQGPELRPLASELATSISNSGRKTAAVVDFTDLQGCVTELGRYIAEDLSVALVSDAKGFDVIDRTNLRVLMQEHQLSSTGIIDPATARKLGQFAGVNALVTGTIAPLSDNVHVSAKLLDTESARVLGGITADIPRTKTIDDLLAKGVANCGTPSTANPIATQVAGPSRNSSQTPTGSVAVQIGAFQLSINVCRSDGELMDCFGSIVNQDSTAQRVRFNERSSYMIDNLGNQSRYVMLWGDTVRCQIGSGGNDAKLEPNLPMKVLLSAQGLSDEAASTTLVMVFEDPGGKFILRDIPIRLR